MAHPLFALFAVFVATAGYAAGEVAPIAIETPYNHVTIQQSGSIVEMRSVWRRSLYRESAVDLSDRSRLIVPYTVFVAASAIFDALPRHALMIGLGGGGLNQFFERAFPSASLDTVELDPQVFTAAQQYLGFKPSEKDKVIIQDGRMFLRRSKDAYDWIILDAFRGGFVPPHLKTVEFYKLARSHLTSDGIFVANVRSDTELFLSDVRTIQAVFPQVGYFKVDVTNNAVIVAANFASPPLPGMLRKAGQIPFNESFRRNIDLVRISNAFRMATAETGKTAPLLTDDFAPTEFLDAVKNNDMRK